MRNNTNPTTYSINNKNSNKYNYYTAERDN